MKNRFTRSHKQDRHKGITRTFRAACVLPDASAPLGKLSETLAKADRTKNHRVTVDDRTRFGPGGGVYRIVTTAKESHGRHFAFESIEPPGGGPPLHTHATEDEFFLVLDGKVTFYNEGQVRVATPGQSVFVPRGAAHCFKNCSTHVARLLVLFTPGKIEGFFDYGLPVNGEAPSDEHLLKRILELGPQYGLEILGPSPI